MRLSVLEKTTAFLFALLSARAPSALADETATVVVGDLPSPIGWVDGVCYAPVANTVVGDKIEFNFDVHNVYKMASKEHYDTCDFRNATLLAQVGEGQLSYVITPQDAELGSIYFACQVNTHCAGGNQKLRVDVLRDGPVLGDITGTRVAPTSRYVIGANAEDCAKMNSDFTQSEIGGSGSVTDSSCTEPVLQEDGTYYTSCVSGPLTMTPGGVINEARILHYPYPKDHRVKAGLRTWEFVTDIPGEPTGAVQPVPINQLYVHHLSGRVVLGQGTEGVRRKTPDAPFPEPYGMLSGDEGDLMIFHIIDLRETGDNWLPCIECRCKDDQGTYLDRGGSNDFGVSTTGGVSCCTNCTSLSGPTLDYRMRYNVSYSFIEEGKPVSEIRMVSADISPAVGKNLEFDVPKYDNLPSDQIKEGNPFVQRLTREGPFNEIFKNEFFGDDYSGPETVRIFRCVGHLHVAAVGMWLEDATTGEVLCKGIGRYGTDPAQDKDFLNAVSVDSFEEPVVISADHKVRLVTEYDATILHTGVMGMWLLFIDGFQQVAATDAGLTVDVCVTPTCDTSLLPSLDKLDLPDDICEDKLPKSPICRFGGLCDCDEFVNAPESTGCGGVFTSDFGDVLIDSYCAKYCGCPGYEPRCDTCPDEGPDKILEEATLEFLEKELISVCHYATPACHRFLSNLYSCATEEAVKSSPGLVLSTFERIFGRDESSSPELETIIREKGKGLAVEFSKLGHPSLHAGESKLVEALPCTPTQMAKINGGKSGGTLGFLGDLFV